MGCATRGTSNTNRRGSTADRRRRKCWLLSQYGDGITVPCHSCKRRLLYSQIECDRIIPGALGGGYARGNIRPACGKCNRKHGAAIQALIRKQVPAELIIEMSISGKI